MTPEGIEQNDFIYELMNEMGWRAAVFDLSHWTADYSERRYGKSSINAKKAWSILLSTVYNCSDNHADHNHGIPVSRPALNLKYSMWYTIENITKSWGYLIAASSELSESRTYRLVHYVKGEVRPKIAISNWLLLGLKRCCELKANIYLRFDAIIPPNLPPNLASS